MAITINEINSGMGLLINGEVFTVTEFSHVKPGKGSAFVRVKLKSLRTENVIERTFKSADKLDDVYLENKELQYTYRAGDTLHFMDQEHFEEVTLTAGQLGEALKYLQENLTVTAIYFNNKFQKVLIPTFIIANIIETEPGFKGDTSRAGTKPAIIDTGLSIQVPLFINKGDWVKVDTRVGQYVERVQK